MSNSEDFILYINMDANLPEFYMKMAETFREDDVTLLPVQPDQLISFVNQKKKVHILCPTLKLSDLDKFDHGLSRLLKNGLKTGVFTVYHFSSFKTSDIGHNNYGSLKNYFFLQTPLKVRSLVKYIVHNYRIEKERLLKWPGGRRSRLPEGSNVS